MIGDSDGQLSGQHRIDLHRRHPCAPVQQGKRQ